MIGTIRAAAVVTVTAVFAMLLSGAHASLVGPPAATFSQRFAIPVGSGCSARSWPYFETRCLRMPDGSQARPARIIVIDR